MPDFRIPTEFDFGQQFDRRTLSQAMELQPEQALLEMHIEGSVLHTRMRGAGVIAYQQSTELPVDRLLGLRVRGRCSCPVGSNCKHVAAALMAFEAQQIRAHKAGKTLVLPNGRAAASVPASTASSTSPGSLSGASSGSVSASETAAAAIAAMPALPPLNGGSHGASAGALPPGGDVGTAAQDANMPTAIVAKPAATALPDLPNELATWLVQLRDATAGTPARPRLPAVKQLMYVLRVDGAVLRVGHAMGTLRRNGDIGTHRPHAPTAMDMLRAQPGYLDDVDQRLLAALVPLADATGAVVLRGRGAAEALRLVVQSQRAWLATASADTLPTPPGPPLAWSDTALAVQPEWFADPQGLWRLRWRGDPPGDGGVHCVAVPEPHALSARDNRVQPAAVQGVDFSPTVADWLGGMPAVPADAMPQLARRLHAEAAARQITLPLPPVASVRDFGALPLQAVLRLTSCPDVGSEFHLSGGGSGLGGLRLGGSRPRLSAAAVQPAAQLLLRYLPPDAAPIDFHFPCGAAATAYVDLRPSADGHGNGDANGNANANANANGAHAGPGVGRFERDGAAEAEAVRTLFTSLELRPWSQVAGMALERLSSLTARRLQSAALPAALESRPIVAVPLRRDEWPALLAERVPKVQQAGWLVETADDFPFELHSADDWELDIGDASTAAAEWFRVGLRVQVDGKPVDLLPLLIGLVQSGWLQSDTLARAGAQGDVLVPWSEPGLPAGVSSDGAPAVASASGAPAGASAPGAPAGARDARQRLLRLPAARVAPLLDWLRRVFRVGGAGRDPAAPVVMSRHDLPSIEAAAAGARVVAPPDFIDLLAQVKALRTGEGLPQVETSPRLRGVLRPYQRDGLAWMDFLRRARLGGVLADDMGLGKTLQALALLQNELDAGRLDRPSLVVVPTSLVANWQTEATRFAPDLRVLVLHGARRAQLFDRMADHHLVVTTYPLAVRDIGALGGQAWHYLILDEAQRIKNSRSQATLALKGLMARHRLALSGTPLENHLGELWSLMDFVCSGLLGSEAQFRDQYRTPIEKRQDLGLAEQLGRRVRPFILRRTKQQVATELPSKTETLLRVELAGAQADLYETVRATMDEKLREAIARQGLSRSRIMVLDALLKLRQVCCDPRLLKMGDAAADDAELLEGVGEGAVPGRDEGQGAGPSPPRASGAPADPIGSAKLELLMELLPTLVEDGRRVLLFSQFTQMLALIEPALTELGLPYLKLTGETRDRGAVVDQFQNGDVPLFLISLKAGGVGLNLTAADTVILYDPWWNPAVEQQAVDRAHRLGQDKPVFVYRLLATGTVEEKMLALQARKAGLADALLSGAAGSAGLTERDFDELLQPMGR